MCSFSLSIFQAELLCKEKRLWAFEERVKLWRRLEKCPWPKKRGLVGPEIVSEN